MTDEFETDLLRAMPRAARYARSLTKDGPRAEDLLQESLARALEKRHQFVPGSNMVYWLLTIVHSRHVNEVRRSVREAAVQQVADQDRLLARVADPASRDPALSFVVRDVAGALARLGPDVRRLIRTVGVDRVSYEEASRREGVPLGTVRSRLSRGRRALREWRDAQ